MALSSITRASGRDAEVKNPLTSLDDYDTIILGYPCWWGTMPMVYYTFLESYGNCTIHFMIKCN